MITTDRLMIETRTTLKTLCMSYKPSNTRKHVRVSELASNIGRKKQYVKNYCVEVQDNQRHQE